MVRTYNIHSEPSYPTSLQHKRWRPFPEKAIAPWYLANASNWIFLPFFNLQNNNLKCTSQITLSTQQVQAICNFWSSGKFCILKLSIRLFSASRNVRYLCQSDWPEKVCSHNSILGRCLLSNNIEINSRRVCCQNTVTMACLFYVTKYWLFKRNIFNNSLQWERTKLHQET